MMTAALRALTIVVWSLAYACWVPEPDEPLLLLSGTGPIAAAVQAAGSPSESRRRRWLARRTTSPPMALATTP
jgi:hypothetical protein